MPATAATVQADVYEFFGIETFDHAPAGLSTFCLNALNGVLQQIYTLLPDTFWRESDPRSLSLLAPRTISVAVVNGAKSITFVSPAYDATTMEGCTLVIAGDATQNRLVHDVSASPTLWKAYAGTTGTVTATLYHDAITLADAEEVMPPVILDNHYELLPLGSERERQTVDGNLNMVSGRSAGWQGNWLFPLTQQNRAVHTPTGFLISPASHYQGAVTLRMLLSALPDTNYTLTYRVKGTVPARVTAWTDARTWLVPHDYVESILLPMVRHALTTHPNAPVSVQQTQTGFDTATKILTGLRPRGWQPSEVETGTW